MKISTVCFPSPCLHGADYPISASRALRPIPERRRRSGNLFADSIGGSYLSYIGKERMLHHIAQ